MFGFYLLLVGLLVFLGVRSVKKVKAPERAIKQGKQIPSALKGDRKSTRLNSSHT